MKLKDYVIVVLLAILTIVLSHQTNIAAEGSFGHVIPIDGPGGSIRFFDSSTGILYSYDKDLQAVSRIVQIEELGEPGKEMFKAKPAADLRYKDQPEGY